MNFIDYFCIVNRRQREIQFARACMVRHVPCSIWSFVLFACLTDIVVKGKGGRPSSGGGGGGEARDGIATKGAQSKVKRGDRWRGADGLNGGGGGMARPAPPPPIVTRLMLGVLVERYEIFA